MVLYPELPEMPPAPVLHPSIAHVAKPAAANAHAHTQYLIRVADARAPGLHWTVYRRYSEFRAFKLKLGAAAKAGAMCAGCAVMAKRTCFMLFPPRRMFGNLREKTLETRRIGLNAFLEAVAAHARACGARDRGCPTRALMDQFLMVSDMRYTYLNVNLGEGGPPADGSLLVDAKLSTSMAETPGRHRRQASLAARLDTLSRSYSEPPVSRADRARSLVDGDAPVSAFDGAFLAEWRRQNPFEPAEDKQLKQTQVKQLKQRNDDAGGPTEDAATKPRASEKTAPTVAKNEDSMVEGLVLRAPRGGGAPTLLSYAGGRRSRTGSWTPAEDTTAQQQQSSSSAANALRPHSISDWGAAKAEMSAQAPRHSDPGLSTAGRHELLNFRGSFSSAGGTLGGGLLAARPRSRKVHLSSAAKRIKRLEEQEARFGCQLERPRRQRVAALPSIPEEP